MPDWGLNPPDEAAIVAHAVVDRANQARGHPPEYIPLLNDQGEHLMHFKYLAKMTLEQNKKPACLGPRREEERPDLQ